jgi:putative transposase
VLPAHHVSVLEQEDATRERRDQLAYPVCQKRELLATAANQTVELGHHQAYAVPSSGLLLPLRLSGRFSRYVVGWMVALREGADFVSKLIEETCPKQIILPGRLTIHSDRGSSVRGNPRQPGKTKQLRACPSSWSF